jgi:hypothetical protein
MRMTTRVLVLALVAASTVCAENVRIEGDTISVEGQPGIVIQLPVLSEMPFLSGAWRNDYELLFSVTNGVSSCVYSVDLRTSETSVSQLHCGPACLIACCEDGRFVKKDGDSIVVVSNGSMTEWRPEKEVRSILSTADGYVFTSVDAVVDIDSHKKLFDIPRGLDSVRVVNDWFVMSERRLTVELTEPNRLAFSRGIDRILVLACDRSVPLGNRSTEAEDHEMLRVMSGDKMVAVIESELETNLSGEFSSMCTFSSFAKYRASTQDTGDTDHLLANTRAGSAVP